MIRNVSVIIIALLVFSYESFAQNIKSEKDFMKLVNEADGYFIYDQDYERAASIYEILYKEKPKDHNIAYKLGVCYLNINGKHRESLELLRYASQNYSDDLNYSTIGEPAHFDVLYYLAYSAQINNYFDEAIDNYKKYQNLLRVKEASEIEFIDLQIKACRNALEIPKPYPTLKKKVFSEWMNAYPDAVNPVISGNDSIFLFTTVSESGNKIYMSEHINSNWSEPKEITSSLGKHSDMYTNSITYNGETLIISRNNGIRGDLYISYREDGKWSKIHKLGKNINTPYWESFGAISGDGNTLFFSSNKPGGYGSLDIYYSQKDKSEDYGPARNIGPVINTKLEENTPYYDQEKQRLWFSSTGHEGYGGYDIYESTYERRWSSPVHLEYPINNSSDNLNYIPGDEDDTGIMSLLPSDTSSTSSIFFMILSHEEEARQIFARGQIKLGDGMEINNNDLSIVMTRDTFEPVTSIIKADTSGCFEQKIYPGSYSFIINYPGYSPDTVSVFLSDTFKGQEIRVDHTLVPESVSHGKYIKVSNILFGFDRYDLTSESMMGIEKIIPVLVEYPELKVELVGYADSIGSFAYNIKLSSKRARSVANYLESEGISSSRTIIKSAGSTNFISPNSNKDGSDNPEGRKYNRRVSINIINDGYYVPVDTYSYIPRHLRASYSYTWYVLLTESNTRIDPTFFSNKGNGELSFVKEIKKGSLYSYVVGEFFSRADALGYLSGARELGFKDARIISRFELNEESENDAVINEPVMYTIQIHALTSPTKEEFKGLSNVRMIKGADGFYRYVVGEYYSYSKARIALKRIQEMGYPQAFIKELTLLENQTTNSNK